MDNNKSVWEMIEEDQEDYQYFKQQDEKLLHQTIEMVEKNGVIEGITQ